MSQQSRRTLLVLLGWLASRVPLYLLTTGHIYSWYGRRSIGDISVYLRWMPSLTHGALPIDPSWQYPPLVGPLLLLPKLLPGADYQGQFVRTAFIADAVVLLILLWTARRRGSWRGPWFWIVSVPLLGPLIYGRFDVFSALFVVAALALLGRGAAARGGERRLGRGRWPAGILIGLGAAVKVWPGLTVFGMPRTRRGWQTIATAVAAAGGASLLCALAFRNSTWFLHNQGNRGIEIESVWAIPFLLAKRLHWWHGRVHGHYGSMEVLGSGVSFASDLALFSTGVTFTLLAWWWWRKQWRPSVVADATLVSTLLMIVTSRVISPQVPDLAAGHGPPSACCPPNLPASQRPADPGRAAADPVDLPYNFNSLIHYHLGPVLVLILRDGLLVAATAVGFVDLWRDTITGSFLPWRGQPADLAATVPAPTSRGAADTGAPSVRSSPTSV